VVVVVIGLIAHPGASYAIPWRQYDPIWLLLLLVVVVVVGA